MEIIGALKKSRTNSTIYFCTYTPEDFDWQEVVVFLQRCQLMQDLAADDIYCIAVESEDNLSTEGRIVGIIFRNGEKYISLVPQEYSDLELYLKELTENE
jgi:hypothetical protein